MLRALALHPFNRSIVASSSSPLSSSSPPAVLVWDSAALHAKAVSLPLTAADCGVRSLGFSCDGLHLATLSSDADCTLRVWHWATAGTARLRAHGRSLRSHPRPPPPPPPPCTAAAGTRSPPLSSSRSAGVTSPSGASRTADCEGRGPHLPARLVLASLQFESLAFSAKGYACVGTSCGSVLVYTEPASPPRSFPLLDGQLPPDLPGGVEGRAGGGRRGRQCARRQPQHGANEALAVRQRAWWPSPGRGEGECVVGTRDGRVWRHS